MHRSPASQRRRAKVRRRDQIRRRRAVTLAVLVTLIVLAVWAAYAIPGQTPARVPQSAAMPTVDGSPAGAGDVVVAQVEGLDFVLPVAREVTTAVAYHPVDNADTVPFAPAGDRLSGGSLGQKLAAIFAGGGAIQYYLMDGADVQPRHYFCCSPISRAPRSRWATSWLAATPCWAPCAGSRRRSTSRSAATPPTPATTRSTIIC